MRRVPRAGLTLAVTAVVAMLASTVVPLPAVASTGAGAEIDGWQELMQYVKCALSVAGATAAAGGWGFAVAVFSCIYDELFG